MIIESLYPFWDGVHADIVDTLQWLPDSAWTYKPAGPDMRSIRQIVLHMIDMERYWMVHLAQNRPWDHPNLAELRTPALLIEALAAVRNQTRLYIETLDHSVLKAVRTVPVNPVGGSTAVNRSISWLIWQTVQHDIYHWGQIEMRRYEALPG